MALAFPCHPDLPIRFLYHGAWAYVCLVPLLASLDNAGSGPAFRRGWVAGTVFNGLSLYWVAHTQGGGLAVAGGALLLALYLGLFVAGFSGCLALVVRRWGMPAVLTAPVLWTAFEYLLSVGELGFPWLLLGHSQAAFPSLIQGAAYTAVYGTSLWVVLVNSLVYLAASAPWSRAGRAVCLGLCALVFGLPWLYGRTVLAAHPPADTGVRVGVVQNNIGREKWQRGGLQRSFESLEGLSRAAAARDADLLVWPETAVPCHLAWRAECRSRVEQLVEELDTPLLTGAPDADPDTRAPYNAAFYFAPGRSEYQTYAKMHLVPFGERTPFRDRIPLLRDIDWSALTGDLGPAEFVPGDERALFGLGKSRFATLICFETVFPDFVRRSVREGADFLVNITNDSWFGATAGPYQHAQLAVLRAVENRIAVARCATSGISLFIDPWGRTYEATELFTPAVRVAAVSLRQGDTFYTRHGDLVAQMSLAAAIALVVASRRRPTST